MEAICKNCTFYCFDVASIPECYCRHPLAASLTPDVECALLTEPDDYCSSFEPREE